MPAKATRAAFGEALLELGARDDRIVSVDADLSKSTMTVSFATKQAVAYAIEHDGPLYLRLTRQNMEPVCPPDSRFRLGRWLTLNAGVDVTLVGSGGPIANCVAAAKMLAADGISAEVVNASSIKPLDEEALLASAGQIGRAH